MPLFLCCAVYAGGVNCTAMASNTWILHTDGACKGNPGPSGIGIALLGAASGMEVTGNQISGNVPSGPTPVSGGVVVSTDPFFGETTKPRNNSVTGNLFGHNKPDIFWDESGSGNRFVGNLCDTSKPKGLCK